MTALAPDMDAMPRLVRIGRRLIEQDKIGFSFPDREAANSELDGLYSIERATAALLRAIAEEAEIERDAILRFSHEREHLADAAAHLREAAKSILLACAARGREAEHADLRPGTAHMIRAEGAWSGWEAAE